MKSTHRNWLTATAATVGAGALAFGGAVLPAAAEESPAEASFSTAQVETDKYELAAQRTGETVDELKQLERSDEIKVSESGFVMHVDPAAETAPMSTKGLPAAPEGAQVPGNPDDGSRPGADVTVYLDFEGETLEGTHWNDAVYEGDPPTLVREAIPTLNFEGAAAADTAFVEEVWAAVAEDYAPFDVNVTIAEPKDDDLYKTSADDDKYGSHVIITDSYDETLPEAAGTGGLAWLGGVGSDYLTGALVFTEGVGGGNSADATARSIADTASHEAGHNFGLQHDGHGDDEYYQPTDGVWGPIMGATYQVPLSQWSMGEYNESTQGQDDLAIITDRSKAEELFVGWQNASGEFATAYCYDPTEVDDDNPQPGDEVYGIDENDECDTSDVYTATFTYTDRADPAADEVDGTLDTAKALDNTDGTFEAASAIETSDDVDVYSVTTTGGTVSATVEVADLHPNLDAKLTLRDEAGDEIAANDPAAERESEDVAIGLGASVSVDDLAAGTYYLSVEGVGFGDPSTATGGPTGNAGGYTDYGSLGYFALSGEAAPFETDPIVIESPADGSEVTGGSDVEVTGTATPGAEVELTVASDQGSGIAGTATADDSGAWTATVTANEYGETSITASQTVDGIEVPETDSVTVLSPVEAPAIQNPADGSTTDDTSPTVTGTGIPGAEVTLVVDGVEYTATVDEDGNWEVTTDVLADGEYTATATQSINGATSDELGHRGLHGRGAGQRHRRRHGRYGWLHRHRRHGRLHGWYGRLHRRHGRHRHRPGCDRW